MSARMKLKKEPFLRLAVCSIQELFYVYRLSFSYSFSYLLLEFHRIHL